MNGMLSDIWQTPGAKGCIERATLHAETTLPSTSFCSLAASAALPPQVHGKYHTRYLSMIF